MVDSTCSNISPSQDLLLVGTKYSLKFLPGVLSSLQDGCFAEAGVTGAPGLELVNDQREIIQLFQKRDVQINYIYIPMNML